MKVIHLKVTDKIEIIKATDGKTEFNINEGLKIASGNYRSVLLSFEFLTDSWNEKTLVKYATFNIEGGKQFQCKLERLGDYEFACFLPYSVAKQNCKVALGTYGEHNLNGELTKIVSSANFKFLITDGSFSVFLEDESPVHIEELEEQFKNDLTGYTDEKIADFNQNYKTKMDNLNSNILSLEENITSDTPIKFDDNADSKRIEQGINNYFAMTPDPNVYTVRFPLFETSNTCAGEKQDANADKYCNPATDTVAEESNYGPAWNSIDCNAFVDNNGIRHITAIKGMSKFVDKGRVDVYCLFRTYYQKIWVQEGYLYISRTFMPKDGYTIVPQAINKDGTFNQWFLIAKYVAGDIPDDDTAKTHKLYSSKGLMPARAYWGATEGNEEIGDSISYSGCIDLAHKKGKYYSVGYMADYYHLATTFYLKFATKDSQSILCGNTKNNIQVKVSKAEANVSRVIIPKSKADLIDVNTYVSVGDIGENTSLERAWGYISNLANDVKVISKTVIDSNNVALNLDHAKFNTTLTTLVSTFHERSGYSDLILGRTGSVGSNTNGRHGAVLDGVEVFVGGTEVVGNAIANIVDEKGTREIYFTNDATKLTGDFSKIKSTYKKSDYTMKVAKLGSDNYITEAGFDVKNGLMIPTKSGATGASALTGYADSVYVDDATTGQEELLLLGSLPISSGAGFARAGASSALSSGYWDFLARLSVNGVGGELAE